MNVRVDVSVPPSDCPRGSGLGKEQKKFRIDLHVRPDSRTTKDATVSSLCQSLEEALPDIHAYRCKLIHSGRLIPLWSGQQNADRKLQDYGIRHGSVLKLMLSPKSAIDVVNSMRELPRMPDVEYEKERERRRRAGHSTTKLSQFVGSIEPWDCPKHAYPNQNEARKLLRAVANDAAIVHIMSKHSWRIGILSEMPPMGRVGISPVCLLGCNINHGQEITLRLRTDDMKGFRKFDMIRKTMIHELAHMVYSEHDDDFKELNSRLNREAQEILSKRGRPLIGEVYSPQKDNSTPDTGPHRFAKDDWARRYDGDAKAAARHAALHRHGAAHFSKGDKVRYFNKRENTWQDAKILAIDFSVQPPSYGIEILDEHGEVHQRETEESRLAAVPIEEEVLEDVEGEIRALGHQDATTRALENQVSGTLE